MDIAISGHHLDPISLAIGAGAARTAEAALVRAVRPLPRLAVGLLRKRVLDLAAAGRLDSATLGLLKSYARATFAWVDQELPDSPGPAKMAAALDRLAAIPYLGAVVRADRAGAQEFLQAAYDAVKQEAKERSGADAGATIKP
jgi:hypothetical protein